MVKDTKQLVACDSRALAYGTYLRLQHVLRRSKKTGYVFSEINVSGSCPEVYLGSDSQKEASKHIRLGEELYSALFQILPERSRHEELMG